MSPGRAPWGPQHILWPFLDLALLPCPTLAPVLWPCTLHLLTIFRLTDPIPWLGLAPGPASPPVPRGGLSAAVHPEGLGGEDWLSLELGAEESEGTPACLEEPASRAGRGPGWLQEGTALPCPPGS